MGKMVLFISAVLLTTLPVTAQTVYEFSFSNTNNNITTNFKAFFVDNNDGTGKIRLKFANPANTDSVLVDYNVKEEIAEAAPGCNAGNILYYKLQNPKFIESADPGIMLPGFLCFTLDAATGLYEPGGIINTAPDCNTNLIKFSNISSIDQKGLSKEFVLTYFKVHEAYYRNQFVTNNTKALSTTEQNIKLFLLFVCNVTDTLIGGADRKAMTETIKLFSNIKEFLGISAFIYDTLTGPNFNKKAVLNKIETFLKPSPHDIVVFYYAGHGFRMPKDLSSPGPYIDLRDLVRDQFLRYQDNSLRTEDIKNMILKKGARLNLIISESCNDTIKKDNPMAPVKVKEPPIAGKKGGLGMNWSTQNCRDLFLSAMPTTVFIGAARPYQLAISNPDFGGYFSTFFRESLQTHMGYSKTKVTWKNIVDAAKEQTKTKSRRTWCNDEKTEKCNEQEPFVEVRFGRSF